MDINRINTIFKGRKSKAFDVNNFYAVLVPIIEVRDKLHLLYQVRSNTIHRQPGEISFPGGKIEEEETPLEAALRETEEEMGIRANSIEVIGELDYLINDNNDIIYPFLACLTTKKFEEIKYSPDEVSDIFTVPIDYFIKNKPEVYDMSYKVDVNEVFPFHKIKNSLVYKERKMTYPVYFYEYNNYIIWGLTAKITRNFIRELIKGRR